MNSDKLGKESIGKLCLTMSIPCILAQIVNLLYNVIDRIYIGKLDGIGTDALAGLGLCAPIITIIAAFSSFVAVGGAPLASKALGEGNDDKARKILANGFDLLLFFSVILMIVFYIVKEPLLYLIGASDVTIKYSLDYLNIYLVGTLFVLISVGLNTFLTAQGKSMSAMISVLIGALLNIALDPLFIFVFKMGISGASLATVISQFVSCIYVLAVLFNKKNVLRIEFNNMKIDFRIIGSICALGIAPFVMASTESMIGFVLNRGLRDYGGDIYVSLLTLLQSSMMLITVPLTGFTQGVTPIISYNYGAKIKKRMKLAFRYTLIFCFGFTNIMALIMIAFPRFFGSFYTSDVALLDLCEKYLPIFIFGMLIFGLQRACQTTFVALGEAKISLFIAILRKILLLIPLALILPRFMGVSGIYYSEPIADITAATICTTIFIFRFRKILKGIKEDNNNIDNNIDNTNVEASI